MKTWILIVLAWLPFTAWGGEAKPVADDPVLEQRMDALAEDLRCLVCQNESLASSRADLAHDLRQEIREQMQAGKSDNEVIHYLTQRYGDFVLYRPPMKPITWLLWFGPLGLLAGGAGGFYFYHRGRGRRLAGESLSDEDRKRAAALLDTEQRNPS